jgi:hypothetical protein
MTQDEMLQLKHLLDKLHELGVLTDLSVVEENGTLLLTSVTYNVWSGRAISQTLSPSGELTEEDCLIF